MTLPGEEKYDGDDGIDYDKVYEIMRSSAKEVLTERAAEITRAVAEHTRQVMEQPEFMLAILEAVVKTVKSPDMKKFITDVIIENVEFDCAPILRAMEEISGQPFKDKSLRLILEAKQNDVSTGDNDNERITE